MDGLTAKLATDARLVPSPKRSAPRRVGGRLGLWLLFLLAGCRTPPAQLSGCAGEGGSRAQVLARQLLTDSAIALTTRRSEAKASALPGCEEAACMHLYVDGETALTALEDVIDRAQHRLDVLMFLWDNDPLGWTVAQRLAARAGPNLPVRVLVDGGGNLVFGQPRDASTATVNRAVCWLAHQPHVQVIRTRDGFGCFDHRKLVLADGRLAWSGGRNFTETAFFGQHDMSFTLQGALAGELADLFDRFWHQQGGTGTTRAPDADPHPAGPAVDDNAWARLVATEVGVHDLAAAVHEAVPRARQHVFAENPYFSDRQLIRELIEARQRGVDVQVVLTIASDNSLFNRANRVTANRLLAAGVRVYLYPGMTHVKALCVDCCWGYTGTGNFDPLSMGHDRELGLAISAGPVLAELEEKLFVPDCRPEWELKEPLAVTAADAAVALLAEWLL